MPTEQGYAQLMLTRGEENGIKTWVVRREREHEDKGCGYDEGLPLQRHEKISNFCFSFSPPLHFPPVSLSRVQKFLSGNGDLEHQKETTAEFENFYINSTLNTQVGLHAGWPAMHTQTHANAHRHTVHTHFHAVNTVVAVCYEGFSSITSTVRSLSEWVNPSLRLVWVDTFPAHTSRNFTAVKPLIMILDTKHIYIFFWISSFT